jgi:hypothetical protein
VLITEFPKIIVDYDKNSIFDVCASADGLTHKYNCCSMSDSVLLPGITEWDTSLLASRLMKEIMTLSVPSVPNIRCLKVAPDISLECL